MKKFRNILTAILFFAFTLAFLTATIIRKKGTVSYQENRLLQSKPSVCTGAFINGDYVNQLSGYIADHFAGRSRWMNAKSFIETNVGERIVNDVYIADNMLLGIDRGEQSETAQFADTINKFSETCEGSVFFAAIPSSSGVYDDLLPEYMNIGSEKTQIDGLYSSLDSSVKKIDAYSILRMLNDNYIYYRNDSKWTSYGAYCVYRTVIQKLGFSPIPYDKYTIEHVTGDFRGNLYNKSQYSSIKADMLDIYEYSGGTEITSCVAIDNNGNIRERGLYSKSSINTNDMYRLYLGEPAPIINIKTNLGNGRRLLVIKDDFANCFISFLTQHYSEICVVSPDQLDKNLGEFIDVNDYEQTLFLFGIGNISDDLCFEKILPQ